MLIVNVASQCGLAATNDKELNELHEKYAETHGNHHVILSDQLKLFNHRILMRIFSIFFLGLKILAFPCNQFNGQEPGDSEAICSLADHKKVNINRLYLIVFIDYNVKIKRFIFFSFAFSSWNTRYSRKSTWMATELTLFGSTWRTRKAVPSAASSSGTTPSSSSTSREK